MVVGTGLLPTALMRSTVAYHSPEYRGVTFRWLLLHVSFHLPLAAN